MLPDHRISSLLIHPCLPDHINPASYDMTLDAHIRVPNLLIEEIDVAEVQPYTDLVEIDDDGYVLWPGDFILASTVEKVMVPRTMVARVEGKSSLGRLGLAVHITAGFIDPGFEGQVTLEMVNLLGIPIRLRKGMRIAQIAFQSMDSMPNKSYAQTGHYMGQVGPVESKFRMSA